MKRVSFSIPWPLSGAEMRDILSFGFQVALISYLLGYLVESLSPGYVTSFFNLDILLWVMLIVGFLSLVWPVIVPAAKKEKKLNWKDYVWILLLAFGAVIIVWNKTSWIGWPVKILAPVSGLIVLGAAWLAYTDRDNRAKS